MKVRINKNFSTGLGAKDTETEFEVIGNDGAHKGDCYLSNTGLTWCAGRTRKENGIQVSWDQFIEWMNSDGLAVDTAQEISRREATN